MMTMMIRGYGLNTNPFTVREEALGWRWGERLGLVPGLGPWKASGRFQ